MTREQFIGLVKKEQNALRGFLLALCCGDRATADDIAQETLVRAYLSLFSYSGKGRFRSWLFAIAHNTFLNHKVAARKFEDLEAASSIADGSRADSRFIHDDLYQALEALPPKERSSITLFYLTGYSIREITTITGSTENAVKKQLSRGRDHLKTFFTDETGQRH